MFAKLYRAFKTKAEAAARELRAPKAEVVSRTTWLRLASVFGPLLLLVPVLRLLQYSITVRPGVSPLGSILTSAAPAPLLLLLISVGIYVWLRARQPRRKPVWHFTLTSLLTVLLLIGTAVLAPSQATEWLSSGAFEAIRWDVFLLLLMALAFLFLLEWTRGGIRFVCLVALYALAPLLMFLPAGTFAYFVSTGSFADVTLLKYVLLHFPELAGIISSEMRGVQVLLPFLPLLILLLPLLPLRLRVVRRWAYASSPEKTAGTPWQALLGTLPLLLLLALPPQTSLPEVFPPSPYVSFMQGLVEKTPLGLPPIELANREPPFDTRGLQLIATDSTRRMNIVMIFMESTRARSTTPYNPSLDTTPFLETLARHALVAEQMYAVVPYTNKSLTPLLAGIYPYPHRTIMAARPGGIPGPGLPELLRPHGYRSAFFTPAEMAYERKDLILQNLGFDEIRGGESMPTDGFAHTNYFGYEDRVMIAPSLAWVDERVAADEPFFLAYLTLVAHHPYTVPSTFERRDYGVDDQTLDDYLNAVRYTDDVVRRLFEGFEARGLLDSTLFIIIGDHGQAFGEHKQRMHPDVIWDEALHVPALLYNPVLFPEHRWITGARQQIDLLPTVADALGFRLEGGHYPGISMLQPVPPGRILYFSGWDSHVVLAFRQDALKFICR
ncbi:MAG: LTA synthase family protein, partial [Rhodothermales bacterium]